MLVVIGGDDSGAYHARQLRRARAAGEVSGDIVVVDRDWSEFLRGWLDASGPDDHLIPAPFSPHLLWTWLRESTGTVVCDPPSGWRLPFETAGEPGVRFVSAAGWRCPATCVEPASCPVLHGPRAWDLATIIEARAEELGWIPAVLRCYHLAFGIASVPAPAILDARDRVLAAPAGARALVATSSHCHAALGGLLVERSG